MKDLKRIQGPQTCTSESSQQALWDLIATDTELEMLKRFAAAQDLNKNLCGAFFDVHEVEKQDFTEVDLGTRGKGIQNWSLELENRRHLNLLTCLTRCDHSVRTKTDICQLIAIIESAELVVKRIDLNVFQRNEQDSFKEKFRWNWPKTMEPSLEQRRLVPATLLEEATAIYLH